MIDGLFPPEAASSGEVSSISLQSSPPKFKISCQRHHTDLTTTGNNHTPVLADSGSAGASTEPVAAGTANASSPPATALSPDFLATSQS